MADFLCSFVEPPDVLFVGQPDGQDYAAVIMPFTAIEDVRAPTVTWIFPEPGRQSRHTTVVLRVLDETSLSRINLWAEYANGVWETIYARGQFAPAFENRCTVETIVAGKELEFVLSKAGGWPSGGVDFQAEPIDRGGNFAT